MNIEFSGGYTFRVSNHAVIHFPWSTAQDLVVSSVEATAEALRIGIGHGGHVSILLRDANFEGPEAFTLRTPDGFFVERGEE